MPAEVNAVVSPWDGGVEEKRGAHARYRASDDGKVLNLINPFTMYQDNISGEYKKQFNPGRDPMYPLEMTYYIQGFGPYFSASDGLAPLSGIIGLIGGVQGKEKVKAEVDRFYGRQQYEGVVLRNLKIPE